MSEAVAQIAPGRSLGFMNLGASLYDILTRLRSQPNHYPSIDFVYSKDQPVSSPVILCLPQNGIRLRFDGPDQRLRLIEVQDFTKMKLSYNKAEIFKTQEVVQGPLDGPVGPTGPKFRHIYEKILGPTYAGEYIPPQQGSDKGTYVLSYPGIAFSFPLLASAWSPDKDFVSLLSSSAASPATSMALFSGESWAKARGILFTRKPEKPRSLALIEKGPDAEADEVELAKIYGEGRIELMRRSSPPFQIVLGETTTQDLVTELGPPDAIHTKNDRGLSIHRDPSHSDNSPTMIPTDALESVPSTDSENDDGDSILNTDYEGSDSSSETEENEVSDGDTDGKIPGECFYNYFRHGFDVFISRPSHPSPPSPTAPRHQSPFDDSQEGNLSATPASHLAATKIIFHGNVPGSYLFNRHRRSRWTLEHVPSEQYKEPLTSEMSYSDISGRLKEVFRGIYANEQEERDQQRGMPLNRARRDSPGSSCELLGGWDENLTRKKEFDDPSEGGIQSSTALYGFPGMVFEVIQKTNVVTCLTVY